MNIEIPDAFAELFDPYRFKVFYGGPGVDGLSWQVRYANAIALGIMVNPFRELSMRQFQIHFLKAQSIHHVHEKSIKGKSIKE